MSNPLPGGLGLPPGTLPPGTIPQPGTDEPEEPVVGPPAGGHPLSANRSVFMTTFFGGFMGGAK